MAWWLTRKPLDLPRHVAKSVVLCFKAQGTREFIASKRSASPMSGSLTSYCSIRRMWSGRRKNQSVIMAHRLPEIGGDGLQRSLDNDSSTSVEFSPTAQRHLAFRVSSATSQLVVDGTRAATRTKLTDRAYTTYIVFEIIGLALMSSASAQTYMPWRFEPIQDVSQLTPRDYLDRVRGLASQSNPADPTIYEPLLGLKTGPVRSLPSQETDARLHWVGHPDTELPPWSSVSWLITRWLSQPRRAVNITLVSPKSGPCATLEDVLAVFGDAPNTPVTSAPNYLRDPPNNNVLAPVSRRYNIAGVSGTSVTFTNLQDCVHINIGSFLN